MDNLLLSLASKRKFQSRLIRNQLMTAVIYMCALVAVAPLMLVLFHIIHEGWSALNINFFIEKPVPIGEEGGGMGNCILGSLYLTLVASLFAIPLGIFGGVYLSEFKVGKIAETLRWTVDLLASIPSIVIGLYVYVIMVAPMKGFSAIAGSVALAILMVPIIVKTTTEVLKLLPNDIREAGLALGIPRWRVILFVVVRGSKSAIFTGIALALARVAGETAPLLITAFGNRNWPQSLFEPTPSLPVQIYNYAISPYQLWHKQAWAGALVLIALIFTINLLARFLLSDREKKGYQ